jgi:hypothetical protein
MATKKQLNALKKARAAKKRKVGGGKKRNAKKGDGVVGDALSYIGKSAKNLIKNNRVASNTIRGLAGAAKNYGGVLGNVGSAGLNSLGDYVYKQGWGMRAPLSMGRVPK